MKTRTLICLGLLAALFASVAAQTQSSGGHGVTALPVEPVTIQPGKSATLKISFRVSPGFHINSNKPTQEILIPTKVKLSPPSDLLVGKIEYPAGEQLVLPFMPDEKLSVYSGTFTVTGVLKTTNVVSPGTYRVRGELRYQACSDRQCFPPHTQAFAFDVKVARSATHHRRKNPAQSPDIRG
jgi:Thiol:disulfide interchange protein DsbD, N-terminal